MPAAIAHVVFELSASTSGLTLKACLLKLEIHGAQRKINLDRWGSMVLTFLNICLILFFFFFFYFYFFIFFFIFIFYFFFNEDLESDAYV